jgi:hypothetical protein
MRRNARIPGRGAKHFRNCPFSLLRRCKLRLFLNSAHGRNSVDSEHAGSGRNGCLRR